MTAPPDPERVRRYFNGQAADYSGRSGTGLWRWMRDRETAAVLDLLQPQPAERILDAGSGSGHYTSRLIEAGAAVTALDFSPSMLSALRHAFRLDTIEGDLATTALKPIFDKVLCAGALEFVPNPAAAVANLATALRPDGPGILVLLLPRRSFGGRLYRLFHRQHGFAVNLFTAGDLTALTRGAKGFGIDRVRGVTFNHALRLRRVQSEPPAGSLNPT